MYEYVFIKILVKYTISCTIVDCKYYRKDELHRIIDSIFMIGISNTDELERAIEYTS